MKHKITKEELYELGKGIYEARTTPELRYQPYSSEFEELFNQMTNDYSNFEEDLNNAVTNEVMEKYKHILNIPNEEFIEEHDKLECEIINLLSKEMSKYLQASTIGK